MKSQKSKFYYRIFLLILGMSIGVLAVTHIKSAQKRNISSFRSRIELEQMIPQLEKEDWILKKRISQEESFIKEEQKKLKDVQKISSFHLNQLEILKDKIGLSPKEGKGIIISLADGSWGSGEEFLIHASDLRDIVNLLWGAKASAISINNERVIFNTSIDCLVNTILINNTKLAPPYKIMALGEPENLKKNLETAPELESLRKRVKKNRLFFKIETSNDLKIPGYNAGLIFNYLQ